jgi:hypothetical protein
MIGERTIGPQHGRQGAIAHWSHARRRRNFGIDPVHIVRGRRQPNRMKDHVTQINIGLGAKGDPIGTTKRGFTRGAQLFKTRYSGIGRGTPQVEMSHSASGKRVMVRGAFQGKA